MFFPSVRRRPLLVLLPLLILQLALLSVQIRDDQGTTLLKRGVLQLVSPFLVTTHAVGRLAGAFWSEYVNLVDVRNENEDLRQQVSDLILQAKRDAAQLQQAKRLQSLLDLQAVIPGRTLAASIIGRSPSFLSFTILLNRGVEHGVKKDSPVLTRDGLVGRVLQVFAGSCEVQVLLDSEAAAGALLQRTRIQGVIAGRGGAFLKLNYLLNQEDVQVGDLVVTSGLDSFYPKELPIGQVVRVAQGETVFKEIDVLPLVNFNRLEEVLILLEATPGP